MIRISCFSFVKQDQGSFGILPGDVRNGLTLAVSQRVNAGWRGELQIREMAGVVHRVHPARSGL